MSNIQNQLVNPVVVYGIDHSPWVQTVLIALEDQGIPYHVVHYPLSYFQHGLVFPVCFWSKTQMIYHDSFEIMHCLDVTSNQSLQHDDIQPTLKKSVQEVSEKHI